MPTSNSNFSTPITNAALGGFGIFLIIPTVIAWKRNHPQKLPIIALNILLGWSVLGWIGSLIWSLTTPQAPQQIVIYGGDCSPP